MFGLTKLFRNLFGLQNPDMANLDFWSARPVPIQSGTSTSVLFFEDEGKVLVEDGFTCLESNKSGTEDILAVEETFDLPDYVTDATVYLRGWNLRYLNDNEHVSNLHTLIENIRLEDSVLRWTAKGAISDDNFDNAYEWCYYYTIIAWNRDVIRAMVDHSDNDRANMISSAAFTDEETALVTLASYIHNDEVLRGPVQGVILPRGFGFGWGAIGQLAFDRHLLQIAYNLKHCEYFVEHDKSYGNMPPPALQSPASSVDRGFVSWETDAIFKDNKAKLRFEFGELVSLLGGESINVIQPPFAIRPVEDEDGLFSSCVSPSTGRLTEERVIENVPFDYAIPILAGWDLSYRCEDQHVRELGVRIDGYSYDKDETASTGTLRYTLSSILRDNDSEPGHRIRHNVHILGINAIEPPSGESDLPNPIDPFEPIDP
jgi:hypothetical protein